MPNPEMKTLTVGNKTFDIRDPSKLPLAGGTMTGDITFATIFPSNRILSLLNSSL